ncbi:hypothetical protein REPUB_Repub19eG0086200 [Reevesia pubescens]
MVIPICIFMTYFVVAKPEISPSLAPSSVTCSTIIYDMADCISFLSNGSTDEKPTPSCCSGFKAVLKTDAECICEALKSSAELGFNVNLTKAAILPSACKVSASISHCDVSSSPDPAPGLALTNWCYVVSQNTVLRFKTSFKTNSYLLCYITAANPPSNGVIAPSPNSPPVVPAVPGPSIAPAPSTATEEGVNYAPEPALSGTYCLSDCFFVLISMLVVSFSYISV